jgi:hypothetical protein
MILVPLVDELMCAGDELEIVHVVELFTLAFSCTQHAFAVVRAIPHSTPYPQTATQHLEDSQPRCPLPQDRSRPGRRRLPHEESPGLWRPRESDLVFESQG